MMGIAAERGWKDELRPRQTMCRQRICLVFGRRAQARITHTSGCSLLAYAILDLSYAGA